MPITLSTLFTSPNDIWDALSVEGVDLRLDDHNLASGQLITVATDAPATSTTLAVTATPVALLAGAQLTFDGGNMTAPVTVSLTTAASAGTTTLNCAALTSAVYATATARDSGVNAATGARLLVAARKGTSKVKLYCNSRYDDSQLKLSGSVLDWATTYATMILCMRRAQGCPKSILKQWEEAKEELLMVQTGQLMLEDIGSRGTDWPSVSNITVNPAYDLARARVQQGISEQTPTAYAQFVDWNSAAMIG